MGEYVSVCSQINISLVLKISYGWVYMVLNLRKKHIVLPFVCDETEQNLVHVWDLSNNIGRSMYILWSIPWVRQTIIKSILKASVTNLMTSMFWFTSGLSVKYDINRPIPINYCFRYFLTTFTVPVCEFFFHIFQLTVVKHFIDQNQHLHSILIFITMRGKGRVSLRQDILLRSGSLLA